MLHRNKFRETCFKFRSHDAATLTEGANNAENTAQFMNGVLGATRSVHEAMLGVTNVQFNIMQRLSNSGQGQFSQAVEVASEQVQLVSKVRDPDMFRWARRRW